LPVVAVTAADVVAQGYAQSLARPGKNVTGVSLVGPELGPRRLEVLRELLPRCRSSSGARGRV
jgi:putative ABC transport system substrate-binding protein